MVVELLGGVAADVHLGVDLRERTRGNLAAQLADGRDRALAVWIRRDRNRDAGDRAGLVRLDGRLAEDRAAGELLLELGQSAFHGRFTDLPGDGDLDRLGRLLRELLSQEEVALLRLEAVGQRARPRGARVECEHGCGEREQQAGGEHEADDGAAHDPMDDRAPETALATRLLGRASEEGDAERIYAVPEQREHGGEQRQRRDHGDDSDEDRAGRQAAEDRARDEQQPEHREHERDAAEEHGTAGGGAGGGDRVQPSLAPWSRSSR